MTVDEMKSELDRANGLLVEKLRHQPYIRLDLTLHDVGKWQVGSAYIKRDMNARIDGERTDTPAEAFASIFAILDALPDPDTAAKRAWQGKLGEVIDEGHALNLPDEVMTPLREGSQAMTENLLAAPAETDAA